MAFQSFVGMIVLHRCGTSNAPARSSLEHPLSSETAQTAERSVPEPNDPQPTNGTCLLPKNIAQLLCPRSSIVAGQTPESRLDRRSQTTWPGHVQPFVEKSAVTVLHVSLPCKKEMLGQFVVDGTPRATNLGGHRTESVQGG